VLEESEHPNFKTGASQVIRKTHIHFLEKGSNDFD
jgi:hypothetical protein